MISSLTGNTFHSLSDHPYIYFLAQTSSQSISRRNSSLPTLPAMDDIDLSKLRHNIHETLLPLQQLISQADTDATVSLLTNNIRECMLQSRIIYQRPRSHRRRNWWWSATLCSLRSRLRNLNKLANILKTPESISACTLLKTECQREIRKTKSISWKRFCTEELNNDPFAALKKLTSSSTKRKIISSITCPDGNITFDPSQILSTLSSAFFQMTLQLIMM